MSAVSKNFGRTRKRPKASVAAYGEPMVWLTGGALTICVFMIVCLLAFIFIEGFITFWPKEMATVTTLDGKTYLGEVTRQDSYEITYAKISSLSGAPELVAGAVLDGKISEVEKKGLSKDASMIAGDLSSLGTTIQAGVMTQFALDSLSPKGLALAYGHVASQRKLTNGEKLAHIGQVLLGYDFKDQREKVIAAIDAQLAGQTVAVDGPFEAYVMELVVIGKSFKADIIQAGDLSDKAKTYLESFLENDETKTNSQWLMQLADANYSVPEAEKALIEQAIEDMYFLRVERDGLTPKALAKAEEHIAIGGKRVDKVLIRVGNFELTNKRFVWVEEIEYMAEDFTLPEWGAMVERREDSVFVGYPKMAMHVTEVSDMIDMFKKIDSTKWPEIKVKLQGVEEYVPLDQAFERKEPFQAVQGSALTIDTYKPEAGSEYKAIIEDEKGVRKLVPAEEAKNGAKVIGLLALWKGEAESWEAYKTIHPRIDDVFHEAQGLNLASGIRNADFAKYAGIANREVELAYYNKKSVLGGQINQEWKEKYTDIVERKLKVEFTQKRLEAAIALKDPDKRKVYQLEALLESQKANATDEVIKPLEEYLSKLEAADPTPEDKRELLNEATAEIKASYDKYLRTLYEVDFNSEAAQKEIANRLHENDRYQMLMQCSSDTEVSPIDDATLIQMALTKAGNLPLKGAIMPYKKLDMDVIVRMFPANHLSTGEKFGVYLDRWSEFLTARPREANTEGGVWPAIVGTVLMTFLMCVVVVPFGVMAALYLREYAKAGPVVSVIRIAINNLAGVPSIVYGVFGFGFFCYLIGAFVDGGGDAAGFETLNEPVWFFFIGLFVLAMVGAVFFSMRAMNKSKTAHSPIAPFLPYIVGGFWGTALIALIFLIFGNPFYDGLFNAHPEPVFGKGALIWASFTLALLTLPVVIVATEEALSAVPNSMREGSYACGASKWQTIKRIVLPRAMPGIMTGMILAMARGAGEVAPLMLVGAVKQTNGLPISLNEITLGVDRQFMHLGFHIFDVGFHSPDSEASKPMVFTTTLLLISIVALLNIAAIMIRSKLRKKFAGSQF